ncbi:MAG: FHA domain-containing protein, partial [Bdellovibrionota bacterium]
MIEFKIISTADRSQLSTYQHFGAELTLGRTEGDMLIDDPQLGPLQLRIRVSAGQSTLENTDESVETRLNGRPIEGIVPLKEKDNVTVGKTSIQFLRLDLEPATVPEPIEYRNAAQRFAEGTKEKALLDGLEYLERSSVPGSGNSRIGIPSPPKPKPPIPNIPGRMPPVKPPL